MEPCPSSINQHTPMTLLCYNTATQYSHSYEADPWRTSFPKATEIILVTVKTARLCITSARLSFLAKTAHDFSQTTSDRDSNTAKKQNKTKKNPLLKIRVFLLFFLVMRWWWLLLLLLVVTKIHSGSSHYISLPIFMVCDLYFPYLIL